jgi:DnaJ-like protein
MRYEVARRTLGVSPAATAEDIERAFRRRARTLHPDRGGDPDRFRELLAAREALSAGGRGPRPPLIVIDTTPRWRRTMRRLATSAAARLGRPARPPRVH